MASVNVFDCEIGWWERGIASLYCTMRIIFYYVTVVFFSFFIIQSISSFLIIFTILGVGGCVAGSVRVRCGEYMYQCDFYSLPL